MQQTEDTTLVTFEVRSEPEGGFSAKSRVGTYSMITQGDSLDELHRMIQDLIDDYNSHEAGQIESYALLFKSTPVAA